MRSPHWQYKAQSSASMTVPTTTMIVIHIWVLPFFFANVRFAAKLSVARAGLLTRRAFKPIDARAQDLETSRRVDNSQVVQKRIDLDL